MLLADGPVAKHDPVRRRLGFVPAWLEVQLTAGRGVGEPLCPGFLSERAGDEPSERSLDQFDVRGQLAGRHRMHPSMYRWSKSLLPNYQLTAPGDRMERGHSIEGRLPFLDHPLVERAVAMPASLKVRDKIEKYALREAARPVLTPSVHKRQQHPFMAPPREEPGPRRCRRSGRRRSATA